MTIFDATTKLFSWFRENDSFSLDEDFQKMILISEEKERDSACIVAALRHLESVEFIKKEKIDEQEIWLLKRPFAQFEQTVEISAETALLVAEAINRFCDLIDDKTDYCDCTCVTEKDIRNLLIVYEQTKNIAQENMKNDLT
jgi:formyltetrahydrofolate synthetase